MTGWVPLSTFPVVDPIRDAPDTARIFVDDQVIERHRDSWWVLGPETLTLRKDGDHRYVIVADGEDINVVQRRRVIGTKRMRPRWRWCLANFDPWAHSHPTRAAAVEYAVLSHFETTHPPGGIMTSIIGIDWTDHERIAADIDWAYEDWAHQCHAVSLAIVKRYQVGRVARGACRGVGVHSWVVVGDDCYDESALIVDPTLWSWDDSATGIWTGTLRDGRHLPEGWREGMEDGCPVSGGGPEIVLTPTVPLSSAATFFLDMCRRQAGPLDQRFWIGLLTSSPITGWPAGEIVAAVADTDSACHLVPVDKIGMLTDRNPGGVYLPTRTG